MGGREQLPSIESEERSPPHRRTKEAAALRALVHGPLSSSITSLLSHSRAIPGGKDFHFYNNFDDFRIPVREFSSKSLDLLSTVASSSSSSALSGQNSLSSLPADDLDDAYDWLVNLNDELAERFGAAMDEFAVSRREIEAGVDEGSKAQEDDGFQLVRGKNKKKRNGCGGDKTSGGVIEGGSLEVKVAQRDTKTKKVRPKVPFHMPHVPRPQDEYSILVNNANQPFQHVWLETNEDGSRFVHPLEKLSVNDFIDWNIGQCAPIKPRPLEDTPFKLVEGVKELKELASKLQDATEFAVDLEHNQYRSFQGLTCLMQISTRNEDFVVDTLKLRIHIGPHLREVFKDPHKRKIMHGADRDILWLQRDFGIYVCNLFDTGQSSRVLQLERNSLEYLLHHFCDVSAKKEYQSADWRLRPLPNEMIKYAREDTHYLLYLYDIMRVQLLSKPSSDSANDSAIIEVYKRSYDICIQLYEKELLTDRSYLYVYGLREADLNSQQLAVVAGLFEWRDSVARAEDESTGYILPNRILLEIARQMPLTSNKLRWLVRPKHPVVERYLGSIVSIIRSSIQNAAAFESVVEELKRAQLETLSKINNQPICAETESLQACEDLGNEIIPQVVNMDNVVAPTTESAACYSDGGGVNMLRNIKDDEIKATLPDNFSGERVLLTSSLEHGYSGGLCKTSVINVQHMDCGNIASSDSVKVNSASVRVSKKSTGFGALFGNSKKKPNFEPRTKYADQETAEARLEQINSSVSLPFRSFSGLSLETKVDDKQNRPEKEESQIHHVDVSNTSYESEDIISLDNETHAEPTQIDNVDDDVADRSAAAVEPDTKDEPLSLAEMSLSFQKCLESKDLSTAADSCKKLRNSKSSVKFEPFNYDAAVKQMNFMGDTGGDTVGTSNTASRSFLGGQKGSVNAVKGIEQGSNFQQPRRRQAFPPSGNRSGTFR